MLFYKAVTGMEVDSHPIGRVKIELLPNFSEGMERGGRLIRR